MLHKSERKIINNPLPLTELLYYKSRVIILDHFIECALNNNYEEYNKSEISEKTGIGRPYIVEHIDIFEEMNVVKAVGEKINRYRIPEGADRVLDHFCSLNKRLGYELSDKDNMDSPPLQPIEPESDANEQKRKIINNPLLLTELLYNKAPVIFLDYFTACAADNNHKKYNKTEISQSTGIGRPYIIGISDRFETMGIIESVGEDRKRYFVPKDADCVLDRFCSLNKRLAREYCQSVSDR
ncbi:hypothetical protein [Haloarcula sp. CGMCC 1.2071]|uniref:hypothetical protein n=1 Tax=Haloarcula sp. CGMCC 1.2071 TaxID=3111454 RepID=UPI00300EDEF6